MKEKTTHKSHSDIQVSSFTGRRGSKGHLKAWVGLEGDAWLNPTQTKKLIKELTQHLQRVKEYRKEAKH